MISRARSLTVPSVSAEVATSICVESSVNSLLRLAGLENVQFKFHERQEKSLTIRIMFC